nr:hypothetical protein [Rhodococcus sp. (in: high G+C Gram-positive bacteria)]
MDFDSGQTAAELKIDEESEGAQDSAAAPDLIDRQLGPFREGSEGGDHVTAGSGLSEMSVSSRDGEDGGGGDLGVALANSSGAVRVQGGGDIAQPRLASGPARNGGYRPACRCQLHRWQMPGLLAPLLEVQFGDPVSAFSIRSVDEGHGDSGYELDPQFE